MAERKRIGIIYSYNENWIGGVYYIQNLIKALNYLPEKEKFEINVITSSIEEFKKFKVETKYSKLKYLKDKISYNFLEKFINKTYFIFFKKKFINKQFRLDFIFPILDIPKKLEYTKKLIFWIPDMQEKYLPHFFTEDELNKRDVYYRYLIEKKHTIVFSSHTTLNDFEKFYPLANNIKYIMPFAVVHPNLNKVHIDEVRSKYQIQGDYFISPNQFWQHKNHIVIIEAAKTLKENNIVFKIVFTGKEYDYRNPEYTYFLKQKVKEYNLENEILFLGFIDRIDQLVLIKNAKAVIQPSFFEGWSTVVEDAKALSQTVIASKIPVHVEQLKEKAYYFSPEKSDELANTIEFLVNSPLDKIKFDLDYAINVKKFASDLKQIIYSNE